MAREVVHEWVALLEEEDKLASEVVHGCIELEVELVVVEEAFVVVTVLMVVLMEELEVVPRRIELDGAAVVADALPVVVG